MTDLHDKARALLALREKATQGPWIADADTYGDPDDVSVYAGEDFIANMGVPSGSIAFDVQPNNGRFIAAAHDMADTIRDLLAENERLSSGSICELAASNPSVAEYCRHWESRAEAAEAELKAQVQCTLRALNQRQKAEAQFRALCEAEPCAYEWFNGGHLRKNIPKDAGAREWNALIPRPSMEDCK